MGRREHTNECRRQYFFLSSRGGERQKSLNDNLINKEKKKINKNVWGGEVEAWKVIENKNKQNLLGAIAMLFNHPV